ncbi:MAG: hypothetical protein RR979_02975, partial [Mucinivorans sp.]
VQMDGRAVRNGYGAGLETDQHGRNKKRPIETERPFFFGCVSFWASQKEMNPGGLLGGEERPQS